MIPSRTCVGGGHVGGGELSGLRTPDAAETLTLGLTGVAEDGLRVPVLRQVAVGCLGVRVVCLVPRHRRPE